MVLPCLQPFVEDGKACGTCDEAMKFSVVKLALLDDSQIHCIEIRASACSCPNSPLQKPPQNSSCTHNRDHFVTYAAHLSLLVCVRSA